MEAVAYINMQRMAEKYGAIILTDMIDFEDVERIMAIDKVFSQG